MPTATACPELQDLAKFLLGRLAPDETNALALHLAECDPCLKTVQALKGTREAIRPVSAPRPGEVAADSPPNDVPAVGPTRPLGRARAGRQEEPAVGADARPDGVALAPPQLPDELGRLGPYRVLKPLGAGGMGAVFLAEDVQLRRPVALKVMKPEYSAQNGARERFLREARSAAALEHDHVVTIYQVGEDRGVPYLAMQFLQGESLEARLQREQQLPIPEVVRIGREIALGLTAAHARGLVHRDIKPSNVWLEGERGRVKILDFGLARGPADTQLTRSGAVVGTPQYMSPEQARGQPVDHRTDLFSLGCVLYNLCAGQPPFAAPETMAVLLAVTTEQPRALTELNAAVPELLVVLIMRLLAKHTDDRIASAEQVVRALEIIEEELHQPGCDSQPRRRRQAPGLFRQLVVPLLLGAAAFATYWYNRDLVRFIERVSTELRQGRLSR